MLRKRIIHLLLFGYRAAIKLQACGPLTGFFLHVAVGQLAGQQGLCGRDKDDLSGREHRSTDNGA